MKCKTTMAVRLGLTSIMLAVLTACGSGGDTPGATPSIGGGGGGAGNQPVEAQLGKVSLSLTDATGAAATSLSNSKPLSAVATVVDAKGSPVVNTLVSFNVDPALAAMSPASGTVVTDASGQARVVLTPASLSSSGGGLLKVAALTGMGAGGTMRAAQTQAVISVGASKLSLNVLAPVAGTVQLKAYDSTVLMFEVLSDGKPLAGAPVTLELTSPCAVAGKATLAPQVSTINGSAQLVYRDQGCGQPDRITVHAVGANQSASIQVLAAAPDAASINVASVVPSDKAIVIRGAGGSGRSETATVSFKVVDKFGNPLANQAVSFSVISTKSVVLGRGSDTTDADGTVSTTITSGTEPTAVRVQATLAGGLSTVSDTIAVTTGAPIQAAFSLSAETYNMEGWDYDNTKNDILLLLADQFGNPVADGTPVVFQTDSGAIGTADRGGCNTSNGACKVPLRSQNPRYAIDASAPQQRAGLATISVSTLSNGVTPLTGKTSIFLSGSYASRISQLMADGSEKVVSGGVALSNNSCAAYPLRLRVSDARRNPMPSGTVISPGASVDAAVQDVYPSVVPSTAPRFTNGVVTGDQGTEHLVLVQPDASKCGTNTAARVTGNVVLQIKSPAGNVTVLPVTLSYPGL